MLKVKDELLFVYYIGSIKKSFIIKSVNDIESCWDVLDEVRKTLGVISDIVKVYSRQGNFFLKSKWKRLYSIEDLKEVI